MDPIEQQIQERLASIQNQENFSNYTPSFEQTSLQPEGIVPLNNTQNFDTGPTVINPKEIAANVIKNQALKYAGKKLGLNAFAQNALGSLIGINTFAPLTAVTALTGASSGIANMLRNKRIEKAILKDINRDKQGDITTVDLRPGMQPTAQDKYRGDAGKTQTASSKSTGVGNPYGGGPGGVQSGL